MDSGFGPLLWEQEGIWRTLGEAHYSRVLIADDPDQWVEECVEGTNKTLITYLKELEEWVEGSDFEGSDLATRRKCYTDIRSFYAYHLVPLPRSIPSVLRM
jgi:hypothetical protein